MPENELSQEQLIVLLEATTLQLNGVVEKLKLASPDNLPTKSTVETLVKTTQVIAACLEPSHVPKVIPPTSREEIIAEWDELIESKPPKPGKAINGSFPGFTRFRTWLDSIFRVFRLILPSSQNKDLSNWVIATILAGILVLVLSTLVVLFSRFLTPLAESFSMIFEPKLVATSPLSKSPETPQSTEMLLPPEPIFTPEQNLIGAIQNDIIDLTSQYPEELIGLIEVNFGASCLIITLGKQWYQLTPNRQDTLVNNVFKRSQRLNFRKLKMIDSQGNLIAGSPVVGNDIIIFRR